MLEILVRKLRVVPLDFFEAGSERHVVMAKYGFLGVEIAEKTGTNVQPNTFTPAWPVLRNTVGAYARMAC